MPSKIEIINYGLILAHQKKIFDIDEDNKRARTAKAIYNLDLDEVLSGRNWPFARKQAELSLDGDTPEYDWSFKFGLPGDYLKMIEVQDQYDYQEEDGFILYNDSTLAITYIFRQLDPNKYTPYFATTLGTRLAVDFALILAIDTELSEKMFAVYTNRMSTGGSLAAQSGGPKDYFVEGWVEAREGYGFGLGRGGQD